MDQRDQILHGHWWKFWSRDTNGVTRPDIARLLVEILVTLYKRSYMTRYCTAIGGSFGHVIQSELHDQILHCHWWKFWSRDSIGVK